MKKRTLLLCLAISLLAASVGGGVISVNAAVRETAISTAMLTDSGNINILDWDAIGGEGVYKPTITNYYAGCGGGTGVIKYGAALNLTDGDVVIEYDLLAGGTFSWFSPYIGTDTTNNQADLQHYANSVQITGTGWTAYSDEALTTDYPSHFQFGFTYKAADDVATRVRYTFKADRTVGVCTYGVKADGSITDAYNSMWFKDKTLETLCSGDVYFGFSFGGENASVDNVTFKQDDTVLTSVDFLDASKIVSVSDISNAAVDTSGKVSLEGSRYGESYLRISNPANTDRLVSALTVDGDRLEKAFYISGGIRFNSLTKEFGLATGLSDTDSEIDSYVYFYNEGETTKIASTKTGEAVDLGVNLVGLTEMTPFTVEGNSNGTVTVKLLDKEAVFTGLTVKGKLAFVTDGEGEASVDLTKDFNITTYSYRESEKAGDANNFNTGYVNPGNWAIQSTPAQFMTNPEDAKGVILKDGAVWFSGSGDGSYISTTAQYADYVLEFDFISPALKNRPATGWTYGYGGLAIGIGANSYSGWVNSVMIVLQADFFQLQNHKSGICTQVEAGPTLENPVVNTSEDEDKVSAIKVTVVNGAIKVYAQDITTAEFNAENYVEVGSFAVPSAYGYISLCANESAYFGIDNIRVTSISDPSEEVMNEKLLAYVDRQAIEDEVEPVVLAAPVIGISENVVSWTAVENATGYQVYVNGKAVGGIQTKTSYTIEAEAGKTYEITVVAVGNGEEYLNSLQSKKVSYTKSAAPSDSTGEGNTSDASGGSRGCSGSVGAISGSVGAFSLTSLFASVLFLFRRRRNK